MLVILILNTSASVKKKNPKAGTWPGSIGNLGTVMTGITDMVYILRQSEASITTQMPDCDGACVCLPVLVSERCIQIRVILWVLTDAVLSGDGF